MASATAFHGGNGADNSLESQGRTSGAASLSMEVLLYVNLGEDRGAIHDIAARCGPDIESVRLVTRRNKYTSKKHAQLGGIISEKKYFCRWVWQKPGKMDDMPPEVGTN